jgi:hypothetical protein
MAGRFSLGAVSACPPDPPQPIQLRRQRPGAVLQVQQVAVTVERPAIAAACPAVGVASLRGTRTGVIGPRPAGAVAALVQSRSGRDGDLPGPAGHQVSPPLAWSPGSDQPTKQAGTAQPKPHGTPPPYSPAVEPAGHQRCPTGMARPSLPIQPPTRPPWIPRQLNPIRSMGPLAQRYGCGSRQGRPCTTGEAGGRARTAGTATTLRRPQRRSHTGRTKTHPSSRRPASPA